MHCALHRPSGGSKRLLAAYFRNCYRDTMERAYGHAEPAIVEALQPLLERIDPYHCHQMVFTASRCAISAPTSTLTTCCAG
jgi:hypothetical protein